MASQKVALRKESVDRNCSSGLLGPDTVSSLSARRAWIEIPLVGRAESCWLSLSARRAWIEINVLACLAGLERSLSARRAWIEINMSCNVEKRLASLSARRAWIEIDALAIQAANSSVSLSARRAWIEICLSCVLLLLFWCRSPQGERG